MKREVIIRTTSDSKLVRLVAQRADLIAELQKPDPMKLFSPCVHKAATEKLAEVDAQISSICSFKINEDLNYAYGN